jgi:hypothetical protein
MVGLLELGRRNAAERFEEAAAVATHSSVANSMSASSFHGPRRWISSVLNNLITVSAGQRV